MAVAGAVAERGCDAGVLGWQRSAAGWLADCWCRSTEGRGGAEARVCRAQWLGEGATEVGLGFLG